MGASLAHSNHDDDSLLMGWLVLFYSFWRAAENFCCSMKVVCVGLSALEGALRTTYVYASHMMKKVEVWGEWRPNQDLARLGSYSFQEI